MSRYTVLDWDSAFFGLKIARIESSTITQSELSEVVAQCEMENVGCVYFEADPESRETLGALRNERFDLVESRIEFEKTLKRRELTQFRSRLATELDAARIIELTHGSYVNSRFANDFYLSDKAPAFYDRWILEDCKQSNGRGLVLSELDGKIAGFWSGVIRPDGIGRTGLCYTAPDFRGQGANVEMEQALDNWFIDQGATRAIAAASVTNRASVRMHERCGYLFHRSRLWFHGWLCNSISIQEHDFMTRLSDWLPPATPYASLDCSGTLPETGKITFAK